MDEMAACVVGDCDQAAPVLALCGQFVFNTDRAPPGPRPGHGQPPSEPVGHLLGLGQGRIRDAARMKYLAFSYK